MSIIKDESAQAGGIFMIFIALFIGGIFLVAFGAIENQFQSTNNDIITSGNIPYSKNHYDAMDLLFKYWWGLPIYILLLLVIYGVKNALRDEAGVV